MRASTERKRTPWKRRDRGRFGIFLLRQHVASAGPTELLEAARMDGASERWILARVIA
jgi:ABC-type glycerol-3-phosphate transport system permease component